MPANAFITNSRAHTLKKRLQELIQHRKELKFLMGFFYFSGWRELYESLNRVFEVSKDGDSLSNDELADRFFASLHIALNRSLFDRVCF
jgi:hypothetical protein